MNSPNCSFQNISSVNRRVPGRLASFFLCCFLTLIAPDFITRPVKLRACEPFIEVKGVTSDWKTLVEFEITGLLLPGLYPDEFNCSIERRISQDDPFGFSGDGFENLERFQAGNLHLQVKQKIYQTEKLTFSLAGKKFYLPFEPIFFESSSVASSSLGYFLSIRQPLLSVSRGNLQSGRELSADEATATPRASLKVIIKHALGYGKVIYNRSAPSPILVLFTNKGYADVALFDDMGDLALVDTISFEKRWQLSPVQLLSLFQGSNHMSVESVSVVKGAPSK